MAMNDRIRDAQQRLDRTVRRARLVEDRALARTVRELGERLAHINHGLLQLEKIHDPSNEAFDRPMEEFRSALEQLIEMLGPVSLVCVEDQVYVNEIRVRFDVNLEHATALQRMLCRHNVGGVTYFEALSDAQLRAAFSLFSGEPAPDRPRTALQSKLNQAGLSSIELLPTFQFINEDTASNPPAAEIHRACADTAISAYANNFANRLPNPLPIRRVIHDLIDCTDWDAPDLLSTEASADVPPLIRHVLAVTKLSIHLGHAVGLDEASIADLGVAAMIHDVGFCSREGDRVPSFEEHPLAGLRVLLRQRGFHEARVQRLLVALEHHYPYDQAGASPALYSHIIHIADDYDILTRTRGNGVEALVPPDAIKVMAAQAAIAYDPVLLQIFVNLMGPYPPRSVLRLDNGTTVMSVSCVRNRETFEAPRCRVLRSPDGNEPEDAQYLDLAGGGRVVEVVGSRFKPGPPVPELSPFQIDRTPAGPIHDARKLGGQGFGDAPPTPPMGLIPGLRAPKPAKKK
jgi:HD-GYP domain-containing protein (c-di-GMP phosphodiesterase class II)